MKIDITGQQFGMLIAQECIGLSTMRQCLWRCQCECGNEVIVSYSKLKSGHTQSCGCLKGGARFVDIAGQKYGMLTVLSYEGLKRGEKTSSRKYGRRFYMWKCICDCGQETIVDYVNLVSGQTGSCGCRRARPFVDIAGKRFGRLTALYCTGIKQGRGRMWVCVCDCGNQVTVAHNALNAGQSLSCGCLQKDNQFHLAEGEAAKRYLFYDYQRKAREDSRIFSLSLEEFTTLTQAPCFYCSCAPTQMISFSRSRGGYIYNGIDRIDNTCGYEIGNVRPCCKFCNHAKASYSEQEFYAWIRCIVSFQEREQVQFISLPVGQSYPRGFKLRYREYKRRAKMAGREFSLTEELFFSLTQSLCGYCGSPPSNKTEGYIHTGIDRIDNTFGYIQGNVRPCCKQCNIAKRDHTEQEFLDWVHRVYSHIKE